MKEYTVQMKLDGKWVRAWHPVSLAKVSAATKGMAKERCKVIEKRWEDKRKGWGKITAEEEQKMFPTQFRVASREITDWEAEG